MTKPIDLLREVRKSLASMTGCECDSCSLVARIDEALRLADEPKSPDLDFTSETGFPPPVEPSGDPWSHLIADCMATPCRYPCLRDDLGDWMNDAGLKWPDDK